MSLPAWSCIPAIWSNWVKKHCVLIGCRKCIAIKMGTEPIMHMTLTIYFPKKETKGLTCCNLTISLHISKIYISKIFKKGLSLFLIFQDKNNAKNMNFSNELLPLAVSLQEDNWWTTFKSDIFSTDTQLSPIVKNNTRITQFS